MQRRNQLKVVAAAVASGLWIAGSAHGANYVWQQLSGGNASGSWATATNWNPNLPGGGTLAADDADFSEQNITADSTITLDAPQAISVMTFGDTDPTTPANWFVNSTSSATNDGTNTLNLTTTNNPTVNVLGANETVTINADLNNSSTAATTWGLAKGGPGTLVLTGNNSALTGIIYINNGILSLDFNHAWSPAANIIGDSSTGSTSDAHLELQGGTLNLKGAAGGVNSQTFTANTNLGLGASAITFTQNGATSLSASLGALTRATGATVDITLPTSGSVSVNSPTTSTGGLITDANGSAFATVNGASDWAAADGSNNIVPGSTVGGFYTASTSSSLAGNADVVTNVNLTSSSAVTTIRLADAGSGHTVDLGGNTLTNGGILMPASAGGDMTIQNGSLQSGNTAAADDLVVIQNNTSHSLNISANIVNSAAGGTDLTKGGAGTLVLSGNNTYSGFTYINAGTVSVTGGSIGIPYTASTPNPGDIQIAPAYANSANMNVSGGTVNAGRLLIAGNSGNFAGGTATLNQTGGTINSAYWFSVGLFGTGTYNISGNAILNQNAAGGTQMEIGTFGGGPGIATVNMSGSSQINIYNNGNIGLGVVGNTGSGTFNQNGGAVTFYSDAGTTVGGGGGLFLGQYVGSGVYTYNLNGGTLTVPFITHSAGVGTGNFNFNGGTLKAAGDSSAFVANLNSAQVGAGGAIIDSNGHNVTIPQALSHATALGPTVDGGLTKNGAGVLQLNGASTYTGPTVINSGTLRLPSASVVVPTPVASYSFDNVNDNANGNGTGNAITSGGLVQGNVVVNGGTGGTAMNGTVNDTNNFIGSGASIVPGKFGNALELDGNGSSVDVSSKITDMSGTSNWTLSAWVKTTTDGSVIISKDDGGTDWTNGNSVFYLGSNPPSGTPGAFPTAVRFGGGFQQGGTAVDDGNWHLLTFVDNSGTKDIYVDGNLASATQVGFNGTDVSDTVRIGFNVDTLANLDGNVNLLGALDEIQFYSAALTQQQVQELFTSNTVTTGSSLGGQLLPAGTALSITASGATLDLNGNSQTIGSLSGVSGSLVTLGAGTLTTGGNNSSTSFAGSISGSGGLVKEGTGTFTLSGSNGYTGPTSINHGMLSLAASLMSTSGISVGSGATLQLQAGAAVNTATLNLGPGSTLDLTTNTVNFDTTVTGHDAATLLNDLASAYDAGKWDMAGITSSVAAASHGVTTLGYLVSGNNFEIAYTLPGDTDLNGVVNATDATNMTHGTGWNDFNYDGVVNADDWSLFLLGASYGTPPNIAVPEPSVALAMVGAGLLGAGVRRRRYVK